MVSYTSHIYRLYIFEFGMDERHAVGDINTGKITFEREDGMSLPQKH